jgi:hypothetical protein
MGIHQAADHSDAYIAQLRKAQEEDPEGIRARRLREAERIAQRAAKRAANSERSSLWVKIALAILLPCAIVYGIWYFAVEPMVHYHSLSVACAAHTAYACSQLMGY